MNRWEKRGAPFVGKASMIADPPSHCKPEGGYSPHGAKNSPAAKTSGNPSLIQKLRFQNHASRAESLGFGELGNLRRVFHIHRRDVCFGGISRSGVLISDTPAVLLDFVGAFEIIGPVIFCSARVVKNHYRMVRAFLRFGVERLVGYDLGPYAVFIQGLLKNDGRRQAGIHFAFDPTLWIRRSSNTVERRAG